jgi:hypothetical protein
MTCPKSAPEEAGDTISASTPLSGSITYDYTPPTTTVPEPGTAELIPAAIGVLAFGWWAERRRLKAISQ